MDTRAFWSLLVYAADTNGETTSARRTGRPCLCRMVPTAWPPAAASAAAHATSVSPVQFAVSAAGTQYWMRGQHSARRLFGNPGLPRRVNDRSQQQVGMPSPLSLPARRLAPSVQGWPGRVRFVVFGVLFFILIFNNTILTCLLLQDNKSIS